MKELTEAQTKTIHGGIVMLAIGAVSGLIAIYNLGRTLGRKIKESQKQGEIQ
ncbi:hypothetical protein [Thalassotalea marina]|uniref:Uncharacterized protein n=1 Tax=Thalassotalea marina TaxID=1673741 RepID=A0A919BQQ5_9GAMM|nr:hypothetical protein [Thalassotalea marina]GHG03719.1 hypothetical protein GCM10017161_36240 [Thalassotalea marina]